MKNISIYFTDSDFIFVEKGRGVSKLTDFGSAKIPKGLIQNGKIVQFEKLAKFVDSVLSYSKITARNTNLLLHEKIVTYITLEIPEEVKPRNYDKYIRTEVEEKQLLPFTDSVIDYEISIHNGVRKAFVFGVSEEVVSDYVKLLKEVGLRVTLTDVPALASHRTFYSDKPLAATEAETMFVNVYNTLISINIFSNQYPIFNVIFELKHEVVPDNYNAIIQDIQDEVYRMNNYYEWNINHGKSRIDSAVFFPMTSEAGLNNFIIQKLKDDNQTGVSQINFYDVEAEQAPYDVSVKYLLTMSRTM